MTEFNVDIGWQFDRANGPDETGDRPVKFTFTTEAGIHATKLAFVLPSEQADKLAGDLLNVLSGGIEIAREMPR